MKKLKKVLHSLKVIGKILLTFTGMIFAFMLLTFLFLIIELLMTKYQLFEDFVVYVFLLTVVHYIGKLIKYIREKLNK